MTDFQQLGLAGPVLRGIEAAGYSTPTPIQAAAIPLVVAGRDLFGCAQTGTGKTAAFILPILQKLAAGRREGKSPRALVVVPTRELAGQVEAAARVYGKGLGLQSVVIFGGVGFGPQLDALRRGVDLVVATPGRLLDHMERGTLRLDKIEVLVLDEADRMFDMGFLPAVRRIVAAVPKQRQTLLFSATMPPEIAALAAFVLNRPETVEIGNRTNPAATVEQLAVPVSEARKIDLLIHLLRNAPKGATAIVFTRTKHRADRVAKKLIEAGLEAAPLHGGRSQPQREKALAGLKAGRLDALVATDLAARGIDVIGLGLVVNYDVPVQAEDYIHRIGRTGRAERSGAAITFAAHEESADLRDIERHTGRAIPRAHYEGFSITGPELRAFESAPRPPAKPQGGRGQGGGRMGRHQPAGPSAGRPSRGHAGHGRHEGQRTSGGSPR